MMSRLSRVPTGYGPRLAHGCARLKVPLKGGASLSGSRRLESRRSAKVRFIMLEADVDDGNFSDLAQAITSALRTPAPGHARVLVSPPVRPTLGIGEPIAADIDETDGELDALEPTAENDAVREAARRRVPVKAYRPKVKVVEVDFDAPMSFEDYVGKAGAPKEIWKRFLVVAAWFKEHRNQDGITADHVYTCFKRMDWPPVDNMSDPLWKLNTRDFGLYAKKVFTINHIGVAEVAKMARQAA